jgi:16S rRNA C1402 (ribose-2'-O) methylase RsmI
MATSQQEQLYNEIVEYYTYADRLIKAVEDSTHQLAEQQFVIIEEITARLEECAEKLTNQYIEYIQNGESEKITEAIRVALNNISAKIQECRNKILMLYQEDGAGDLFA